MCFPLFIRFLYSYSLRQSHIMLTALHMPSLQRPLCTTMFAASRLWDKAGQSWKGPASPLMRQRSYCAAFASTFA